MGVEPSQKQIPDFTNEVVFGFHDLPHVFGQGLGSQRPEDCDNVRYQPPRILARQAIVERGTVDRPPAKADCLTGL